MRTGILACLITVSLLAACGGGTTQTPTQQPRPVVTSRSTVAPPTPAPPTPTPVVTPAPAPTGAAADVIDAFFRNFAQENEPFHVDTTIDFTGSAGAQTETGSAAVNGDIHGEDFAGEVVLMGDRILVRFVDGVAYGKEADNDWVTLPDFKQTQPLNPFSLLEPGDVAYVGLAEREGREMHELGFEKWVGGELEVEGMSRLELLSHDFSVFVSTRGIPVEAILDFSISGYLAGFARPFQFDYHVVYQFSDVGKPVDIRAPL